MRPGTSNRIVEFLGLERNVTLLLVVILVIHLGEELWMRFLPKYLEFLGASAMIIGLFDGVKTLLGAVYAYPGGIVADRWGHQRAFFAFTLISIAGYALLLAVPHWAAVIGGLFLFFAWTGFSLPATFSLVAARLPSDKHAMGIAVQSFIRRIPVLVGPLAGGVLIDRFGFADGMRIGFAVSIVLGVVALVVQRRAASDRAPAASRPGGFMRTWREFDPSLRRLLLSDILIRLSERLPFAWVVIYAMNQIGLSATQVGVLIAIEMATANLCYLPASYFADRYGREPFVVVTFLFFTLFPLSLLIADSFPLMALAFVVRGMKEFGDPARKALIVGSGPPESRGRTVGAYYLIRDTVATTGSFIGAALWSISPAANFWSAFAFGAAGSTFYVWSLRRDVQ